MTLDEKATRLRELLNSYVIAMNNGEAHNARNAAYEMLQINQALYYEACTAGREQLRREGRQS